MKSKKARNRKISSIGLFVFSLLALIGCEKRPKTDVERKSYAFGVQVAEGAKNNDQKIDSAMVALAVEDVLSKRKLKMSKSDIQTVLLDMSKDTDANRAEKSKVYLLEGQKYFDDFVKKYSATVSSRGVAIRILKTGTGPIPSLNQTVRLHYEGRLIDGKVFDSSRLRGRVAEFPANSVIPGWGEVLSQMPVGSHWEVVIPANLAYGETGNQLVPRNATLIFDLELLGVK